MIFGFSLPVMPAADCPKRVVTAVNRTAVNLLPRLPQRYSLLVRIVVYAGEVALPVCVVRKFRVHSFVFAV